MELKSLLKALCEAAGVNGETDAAKLASTYLSSYANDVRTDAMGNALALLPSAVSNAPTVLLEAHIDEIGFVVTGIDDRGFVRVAGCGGIDNRTLDAAEVVVLTRPPLAGVLCSTPPHLSKEDAPLPEISDRGIDVGLSKDEAIEQIPVGTRVCFRSHFDELLGDRVCAKAVDDRAGVAAILRALEIVKGKVLPVNIAVSFCVQEELGCQGAKTAAFGIQPDAALVVDVSFAHTHDVDKSTVGALGNGVMIGQAPTLDNTITAQLFALAEKETIPHQHEVMGARTGTDADSIGIIGAGIPCGLLSVPLRYMHTPVEVVSLGDIEATARLMAAFVMSGEVRGNA